MAVDVVFLIDGKAFSPAALERVRGAVMKFPDQIQEGFKARLRDILEMRAKVVVFRDLYADDNAFEESDFFALPDEAEAFHRYVAGVRAEPGGPGSALEALCRVLRDTPFRRPDPQTGGRARHIIVLLADAPAHRLDDPRRAGNPRYPGGMPDSLAGVEALWEEMDHRAKRLIIAAPYVWPWTEIALWDNTDYHPTYQGEGIPGDFMPLLYI